MKTLLTIIVIVAVAGIACRLSEPFLAKRNETTAIQALEQIAAQFPKTITRRSERETVKHVTINVRKTDSLTAPIIGLIEFSVPLYVGKDVDYQMVYHWRKDQWEWQNLTCLTSDVSRAVFEAGVLNSPELRSFIAARPAQR